MIILCVDGLDPDLASDYGFKMPFNKKLEIPEELYSYGGYPWTPHVWGSIFAGRIETYPDFRLDKINPARAKIRMWLINHRIRWHRKGLNIRRPTRETSKEMRQKASYTRLEPILKENLLDHWNSFDYNIPAVSYDYIYGVDELYVKNEFRLFNLLAIALQKIPYELSALYTRKIDHLGHNVVGEKGMRNLINGYKNIFGLANMLSGDVILISDHGTLGNHTFHAYMGCTQPINANSVIEVRKDIETILKKM